MPGQPGAFGPGPSPGPASPPPSLWDRFTPPAVYNPTAPMAQSAQAPAAEMDAQRSNLAAGIENPRSPNLWDRIGGALQQPGMSGAFLRAAGAAFAGDGLGGAIQAGAQSMDRTHAQQDGAAQQQFENQMAAFKLAVAQQQAAAEAGKVHYQVVPEG